MDDNVVPFWVFQEGRFCDRLVAAMRTGTLKRNGDTAICPTCSGVMEFAERDDRMTFGGFEPACVQIQCDGCGIGGEIKPVSWYTNDLS